MEANSHVTENVRIAAVSQYKKQDYLTQLVIIWKRYLKSINISISVKKIIAVNFLE